MKYMRGLLAVILSTFIISGTVGAQTAECDSEINGTGPGSNNTIDCETNTQIRVICSNNIYVVTTNDQSSSSGGANNSGNTTGGNATSGNATNENGQVVQIGASCEAAAASTPTPTTPTPPSGSGQVLSSSTVAALPNTSSASPIVGLLAGVTALGALYGVVRLASYIYSRGN